MPATNTVTQLLNTNAEQTAFTVRNNPVGGSTPCHAAQVTQAATAGTGAGLNLVNNNSSSPALRAQAAGPLIQMYDADRTLKFEVTNAGNITAAGTLTQTGAVTLSSTLAVTGAVTLSSTLAVTGASTLTGNTTVGGTLGVTGAATLSGALNVTGYTTLAGGQANSDWAIFGNLSMFGSGKAYRLRTSGSALDFDATGVDLLISNFSGTNFDGTQRSYFRLSADAQNVQVAGKVEFVSALYSGAVHTLDGAANTLGFHGATPVTKQTVSGSRGGNAALADLLTKLATLGLITDGTSG